MDYNIERRPLREEEIQNPDTLVKYLSLIKIDPNRQKRIDQLPPIIKDKLKKSGNIEEKSSEPYKLKF